MQAQCSNLGQGKLFDPDLPTAKDVMAALCCVATRYALNPSLDLANAALALSTTLTAPEYAESKLVVEVAKRLVMQWGEIVVDYAFIETQIMPTSGSLQ